MVSQAIGGAPQVCNSAQLREVTDLKSTCKEIIVPKSISKIGTCIGDLGENLVCSFRFVTRDKLALVSLACMDYLNRPVINTDFSSQSQGYNLAALIKKSSGEQHVIVDSAEYLNISHDLFKIVLQDNTKIDGSIKANISMVLKSERINLTNISCTN